MKVRCNLGIQTTNKMGYLGSFPKPVWYDPKGIANIMSLFVVQKFYCVTYDVMNGNSFKVDLGNNSLTFAPTAKGLYALVCTDDNKNEWKMITTVKENMARYSQQAYKNAVQARRVQNILMHPGDQQFEEIVDKNLIRSPDLDCDDIRAATDIIRTNIGSLHGKTTRPCSPQVHSRISGIPSKQREICSKIVIGIDILYLNKIPFLVTTSRGLHFGTVEDLPDRKIQTVGEALSQAIDMHNC
jgi:hypothetical protein